MNSTLQHHGVLGMHWGVRRFQNEDGSLTPTGRKKYYNNDGTLTKKGRKWAEKTDSDWVKGRHLKGVSDAHAEVNNRAAERFDKGIGKINSKFEKSNPKSSLAGTNTKAFDPKYDKAVTKFWEKCVNQSVSELFGDSPSKTKRAKAKVYSMCEEGGNFDIYYVDLVKAK